MSEKLFGNTRGLAPSELRKLERLYSRRLDAREMVSRDVAREICQLASQLRRRIGLIISREGDIEVVCVGSKEILYIPDLGRYRLGKGRLRRLRLVFSDLSSGPQAEIPHDIYTDLEKLRLDMVVSVKLVNARCLLSYAHLIPGHEVTEPSVKTEEVADIGKLRLNLSHFMSELEQELSLSDSAVAVDGRTRAILVGVYGKKRQAAASSMEELEDLARTAGIHVLDRIIQRRDPDPRTLLGKGKLEEVVLRSLRLGAEMIVFDCELRPSQWRAITNSTELKVIDRSMLILDIFAQRAQSSDGRLQVELAQLKYNLPRLVEKDAGLSRLTGGIGGRGPGETKLEVGRRRIRDRISDLEKRIVRLSGERQLRRSRRQEQQLPLVAILGYTNVGKSTLFNALTGSNVVVENKLFATLDPANRRLHVAGLQAGIHSQDCLVLSDTVGFIRDLPEELKTAFRATLEELYDARLLVHVVDGSDAECREQFESVRSILREMGLADIPELVVINKIDRLSPESAQALQRSFEHDGHRSVLVSARARQGLAELTQSIGNLVRAIPARASVEECQST